jgi:hypothetical protein
MLTIRREQITEIDNLKTREYCTALRQKFRKEAPQLISRFDDIELQLRVEEATRKARTWGLKSAAGYIQYVTLALAAGPSFDDDPKVHYYLALPGSTPERKIHRLLELVGQNLRTVT